MNVACSESHFANTRFDEAGRQRALDRLEVVDTPSEEPFEHIVDLVKTTLGAPICAVSLIDRDRQWFKAFRGLAVDQTPRDIAFCDHAIRADEPFAVENALEDPLFADNPLVTGDPFIRSYLGIPLRMPDGYIVGTLCVIDTKPRAFSDAEIVILQNFATLVVNELELRTLAFTDGLTSLLSRSAWRARVEEEIGRAERASGSLSILLIDLDHFKQVNDTFGHEVGDLVLSNAAEVVGAVLRKHDLVGRLGGEEFAVCVLDAAPDIGLAVAERIRREIDDLVFPDHEGLSCSASIGVAAHEPGRDVDALLRMADTALYEAKSEGRNRVRAG